MSKYENGILASSKESLEIEKLYPVLVKTLSLSVGDVISIHYNKYARNFRYVGKIVHIFKNREIPDPALVKKYYGTNYPKSSINYSLLDRYVVEYDTDKFVVLPIDIRKLLDDDRVILSKCLPNLDMDLSLEEYLVKNYPHVLDEYLRYKNRTKVPNVGSVVESLIAGFGGGPGIVMTVESVDDSMIHLVRVRDGGLCGTELKTWYLNLRVLEYANKDDDFVF